MSSSSQVHLAQSIARQMEDVKAMSRGELKKLRSRQFTKVASHKKDSQHQHALESNINMMSHEQLIASRGS